MAILAVGYNRTELEKEELGPIDESIQAALPHVLDGPHVWEESYRTANGDSFSAMLIALLLTVSVLSLPITVIPSLQTRPSSPIPLADDAQPLGPVSGPLPGLRANLKASLERLFFPFSIVSFCVCKLPHALPVIISSQRPSLCQSALRDIPCDY